MLFVHIFIERIKRIKYVQLLMGGNSCTIAPFLVFIFIGTGNVISVQDICTFIYLFVYIYIYVMYLINLVLSVSPKGINFAYLHRQVNSCTIASFVIRSFSNIDEPGES